MSESLIRIEDEPNGVRRLVLNRPDKRNALCAALMEQMCDAIDDTAHDPSVRVVIVHGEGPCFCAGLDLKEARDPKQTHASAQALARMLESLPRMPQVSIAAVHGAAVAGGCGLMSACDLVVAEEGTKLGYPEVRRGLAAISVMTFLHRQVPVRVARELLLLGDTIDAQRGLDIGLVNRIVPPGQALDAAREMAALALKGAPGAIAHTKQHLAGLAHRTIEEDIDAALAGHEAMRATDEAQEGLAAFNEKRLPNWDPDA